MHDEAYYMEINRLSWQKEDAILSASEHHDIAGHCLEHDDHELYRRHAGISLAFWRLAEIINNEMSKVTRAYEDWCHEQDRGYDDE